MLVTFKIAYLVNQLYFNKRPSLPETPRITFDQISVHPMALIILLNTILEYFVPEPF